MVLQCEMAVPVWGRAASGQRVDVSFAGQTKATQAGTDGRWRVTLDPMRASCVPAELTVAGATTLILKNILVGEVWVCSGQSNMEWPVSKALNGEKERAGASRPSIRILKAPRTPSDVPLENMHRRARWDVCSPESISNFSAVAYFFGRELNGKLGVPVGLVDSSWGGSSAECWMSAEALTTVPGTQDALASFQKRAAAVRERETPGLNPLSAEQLHGATDNAGFKSGWAGMVTPANATWKDMELPAQWQQRGMDFSGVFWFRKELELPAEWEGRDLKLAIGATDKEDQTYFNGVKVGSVLYEDDPRAYAIQRCYDVPGPLVRKGRNVIAVRVRSDFFDGGMTGPADVMEVRCPSRTGSPAVKLAGKWRYAIESNYGFCHPGMPTTLFNGMVRPLVPLAVRGALWFQGENNAADPIPYRKILPALIRDWRTQWGQGDFAFYIVQLANWQAPSRFQAGSKIALLREAQSMALSVPNTALAVTLDLGEHEHPDCHFTNKQEVGRRLAANAFAKIYGMKDVPCSGPVFRECRREGNRLRIIFDNPAGGLRTSDGKAPEGFVIAGAEGAFHDATATLDGETVLLESPAVPGPVAARYAWADNPLCNLFNNAGFPAAPFRTDSVGE